MFLKGIAYMKIRKSVLFIVLLTIIFQSLGFSWLISLSRKFSDLNPLVDLLISESKIPISLFFLAAIVQVTLIYFTLLSMNKKK